MGNTGKKNGSESKQKKPYCAAQDQIARTGGHLGTIFLTAVAALFILVGSIMLFVDGVQERYLVYMISALLIALGIGLIVKYFVTEAYRSMHDYSFSGGALIVILGGSALARAQELTGQISVLAGLLVLAVAVVMLQQALQMHIMRKSVWPIVLTIAVVTLLAAVVLLFDLRFITGNVEKIAYWILLIAGMLTLLCMIISAIGVKLFLHQEHNEMVRMQKEQELAFARAVDQEQLTRKMKQIEQQEKAGRQEENGQQADIPAQPEDGSDTETQSI